MMLLGRDRRARQSVADVGERRGKQSARDARVARLPRLPQGMPALRMSCGYKLAVRAMATVNLRFEFEAGLDEIDDASHTSSDTCIATRLC